MKKSNSKGFTLIELLVVIAIIGLLSTLAVVALNSARQKSRDSKRVADIKQIQTALELYFSDHNAYPIQTPATGELGDDTHKSICGDGAGTNADGWKAACIGGDTTYMGLVPSKPQPFDGVCDATTNPYTYGITATGTTYSIAFCLGGQVGDLPSGVHTATPNGMQ